MNNRKNTKDCEINSHETEFLKGDALLEEDTLQPPLILPEACTGFVF